MSKIKIYSSLSLNKAEILKRIPSALVAPPIKRGDLIHDIKSGIDWIAIIDGTFEQSLSVSPGEILDAIRAGIRVYGASSMGALRAAELWRYGMIGHGKIFESIVQEPYFRDDFLGQVFDPETGKVLSMTYVDFYFHLRHMENRKRITPANARKLKKLFQNLHFSERNLRLLLDQIAKKHRGNAHLGKAAKAIFSRPHTQKKLDAISLLKLMEKDLKKVSDFNARLSASMDGKQPHFY